VSEREQICSEVNPIGARTGTFNLILIGLVLFFSSFGYATAKELGVVEVRPTKSAIASMTFWVDENSHLKFINIIESFAEFHKYSLVYLKRGPERVFIILDRNDSEVRIINPGPDQSEFHIYVYGKNSDVDDAEVSRLTASLWREVLSVSGVSRHPLK